MKRLDNRIINLPKSAYRLLNPPPPPRRVVLATAALIIITAIIWSIM